MRILLVTDVMTRGGVDVYVRSLARALCAAGHHPEVVIDFQSTTGLRGGLDHEAVPVHRIRLHDQSHSPDAVEGGLHELLEATSPDGIHVVCGVPWACLTLRRLAVQRLVPLILTEQGVPNELKLTSAQRAVILASYRHAHRVIFVSEGNRRRMEAVASLDGTSHVVVPNGVPTAAIALRSVSAEARRERMEAHNGRGLRLMTAARLAPEKGIGTLIEALSLVPKARVAQLTVFGEGPLSQELECQSRDLGVDDIVRFAPWCDDIIGKMRRHDLFVLPSRNEGMSLALLEAMAAGVPAVATSTPGSVEALNHGKAGRLVPRDDPRALAKTMLAAISDPPGSLARASAARARAVRCYDINVVMQRTISLWGPDRSTA